MEQDFFDTMVERTKPKVLTWSEYLTTGAVPPQGSFLDLTRLFTEMGYAPSGLGEANCATYEAVSKAIKMASPANLPVIKHYLTAKLLKTSSTLSLSRFLQ